MKLRRDIASVPLRSGEATWSCIVELVTANNSNDTAQLQAATSIMAMLLAEEHYGDTPLTVKGNGHRLVIYCAHGMNALVMGESVDALGWNPTAGDWTLYVPCPSEDLEWARKALASIAPRLVLHGLDETPGELEETTTKSALTLDIDWTAA